MLIGKAHGSSPGGPVQIIIDWPSLGPYPVRIHRTRKMLWTALTFERTRSAWTQKEKVLGILLKIDTQYPLSFHIHFRCVGGWGEL